MKKLKLILLLLMMSFSVVYSQDSTKKKQNLNDKNGKFIGRTEVKSKNIQEIKDRNGNYLGKYDLNRNTTYDKNGKSIGKGNLLPLLLPKDAKR